MENIHGVTLNIQLRGKKQKNVCELELINKFFFSLLPSSWPQLLTFPARRHFSWMCHARFEHIFAFSPHFSSGKSALKMKTKLPPEAELFYDNFLFREQKKNRKKTCQQSPDRGIDFTSFHCSRKANVSIGGGGGWGERGKRTRTRI